MHYEFSASRVTGGNAVFPDKIIITDEFFIYRKAKVIGYEEKKIRFAAIGSVSIDKHLLFADIIIETNGGQVIVANGFSHGDAKAIARLLSWHLPINITHYKNTAPCIAGAVFLCFNLVSIINNAIYLLRHYGKAFFDIQPLVVSGNS